MKFAEEASNDFDFLSEEQKSAFIRALIYLAKADGNLDDGEMDYIIALADANGISHREVIKFEKEDSVESILKALSDIKERRVALEVIKEFFLLAYTDNELSEEEMIFIGKCGTAMGIEPEKIEQISNWVIDRIVWLEQARIIFED